MVLGLNGVAYFGGLTLWYGSVMGSPETPVWVWPFVPDCPLFGLLGALALLAVTARIYWLGAAQVRIRQTLFATAALCALMWLSTYATANGGEKPELRPTWALLTGSLFVFAYLFRRPPSWLLALVAFGQIKYGIWTITAWSLFWHNTASTLGTPTVSGESVLMTVTHVGLTVQGLLLLTYFRPDLTAVVVSAAWFVASDVVDYGLGYHPAIPEEIIPLPAMQWSTISVTIALIGWFLWLALHDRALPHAVVGRQPSSEPAVSEFV